MMPEQTLSEEQFRRGYEYIRLSDYAGETILLARRFALFTIRSWCFRERMGKQASYAFRCRIHVGSRSTRFEATEHAHLRSLRKQRVPRTVPMVRRLIHLPGPPETIFFPFGGPSVSSVLRRSWRGLRGSSCASFWPGRVGLWYSFVWPNAPSARQRCGSELRLTWCASLATLWIGKRVTATGCFR
jgi:hypothetical protein